jgi:hypothetical protein
MLKNNIIIFNPKKLVVNKYDKNIIEVKKINTYFSKIIGYRENEIIKVNENELIKENNIIK